VTLVCICPNTIPKLNYYLIRNWYITLNILSATWYLIEEHIHTHTKNWSVFLSRDKLVASSGNITVRGDTPSSRSQSFRGIFQDEMSIFDVVSCLKRPIVIRYTNHQFTSQKFYILLAFYFCNFCKSQNRQRLFPYAAITGRFYNRDAASPAQCELNIYLSFMLTFVSKGLNVIVMLSIYSTRTYWDRRI